MTFTTLAFPFCVPAVVGLCWALPRQRARNLPLVAASHVADMTRAATYRFPRA